MRRFESLEESGRCQVLYADESGFCLQPCLPYLCIELLLPTLEKPTVLVLDNAGVHRSKAVQEKRSGWKRAGLRLLFLPPYSPHLNAIEALWRHVKYRWLPVEAYQHFERLCKSVVDVLDHVGTRYRITFA